MRYFIKNKKQRSLILLSLVYLASHGMLLIASGRWWDDWCFFNQPVEELKSWAMQLGRPSLIPIICFAKLLPEFGYRIITFVMFYYCMLFLYKVLDQWLQVDHYICFWICAIYCVIPANDARIMLSVFPYTVGIFFFMAGMSYLIGLLRSKKRENLIDRLITYIIFTISFTLNSCLCFYILIIIMIVMTKRRNALHYLDYFALPLVFVILKKFLFPTYGLYENYNAVSWAKLARASILIVPADIYSIIDLFKAMLPRDEILLCVVLLITQLSTE